MTFEQRQPWEMARARFFANELVDEHFGAQPRSVLEVRAGDGALSRELLARLPAGSEVVCFDERYTDDEIERLRAAAPEAMSFTRERPARRFDVVLLVDVLDDIEDDLGFLSQLAADALEPEGAILVAVPAWPALSTEDERARPRRRYTPATCRALIASARLDLIRSGGLFHALLPIRALAVVREIVARRMGRAARASDGDRWTRGPLFSDVVDRVLSVDNAISRHLADAGVALPGLGFWAIAIPRR